MGRRPQLYKQRRMALRRGQRQLPDERERLALRQRQRMDCWRRLRQLPLAAIAAIAAVASRFAAIASANAAVTESPRGLQR